MRIMSFTSALSYVLFSPFFIAQAKESSPELVAVFTVIRHGDRAPTDFYPNDPFKDASFWAPNGIGELNPLGIERMQQSGKLYLDRYQSFLNSTNGWPTYVRSSTRNRTIESARYFLESFMAPRADVNVSAMIQRDQRMLTTTYPCIKSNAAWLEWFQSKEVTGYLDSKKDDILHLQNLTGANYLNATPFTLRNLEFLATTTEIERDEYKYEVPAWIRDEANKARMADFKKHAYLFDWKPPVVQKYRVGVLLGDIRDNIKAVIEGKSQQRFFLYSTHDVNQVLLLQSLGQYAQIGQWPTTYTSANVFEVYKLNGTFLIRSLYRQVDRVGLQVPYTYKLKDTPLNITNCSDAQVTFDKKVEFLCPVEQFRALVADKVPLNYEEECKSAAGSPELWSLSLVALTLFSYSQL